MTFDKKEYDRLRYLKKKDEINARVALYRSKNKEKFKLYKKEYLLKNKEKVSATLKLYRENNKQKISEWHKQHHSKNKDLKNLKSREYYSKNKKLKDDYRIKNKDKINLYAKTKYKKDLNYKISILLRGRLVSATKNNYKVGSAVRDLGCSIEFFKTYIESKFQPGMTWDNWTYDGWHLDHIIPLCKFDLTNRKELLKACHYTNLQPLWAKENLSKNGRIV